MAHLARGLALAALLASARADVYMHNPAGSNNRSVPLARQRGDGPASPSASPSCSRLPWPLARPPVALTRPPTDRNREKNENRNNANRLFDSQNNGKVRKQMGPASRRR